MRPIIAILAPLALTALYAVPAGAQAAPEPKVNQLIVFGEDPCPQSTDDTITVCARKDEGERFRIPELLREHSSPQNEAWNNKVLAYETVGRTGTMSCSPVGAGGWTGCSGKLINQAYAEKSINPDIKFSQMIAAERTKKRSIRTRPQRRPGSKRLKTRWMRAARPKKPRLTRILMTP
jgi:hypothetical protein